MILAISCAAGGLTYALVRWAYGSTWRRFPDRRRWGWTGYSSALASIGLAPSLGVPVAWAVAVGMVLAVVALWCLVTAILPTWTWASLVGVVRNPGGTRR